MMMSVKSTTQINLTWRDSVAFFGGCRVSSQLLVVSGILRCRKAYIL